jgi:arylsulfatase A-like enzyme
MLHFIRRTVHIPIGRLNAMFRPSFAAAMLLPSLLSFHQTLAQSPPNIILVMMDDVGYGDLGCLGAPVIRTPHIDSLYRQSMHLTNFHTGTTCAPTRAALLTGQHYDKIGVWHTINGRSLLRKDIRTLPEILNRHGYATGIFGKWHLGDNYPMRPQDRGFQYTFVHGGGGVGQTPDYWGNDYFDDTYFRNGRPEKTTGYCTDVWTREALDFISEQTRARRPFFCYIPFNAAHMPHRAPEHNIAPYRNNPAAVDPVYDGMVDNIDENMGKLLARLDELHISDNTVLIFMSDNGTSNHAGVEVGKDGFVLKGFNAHMRGVKGSAWEGGHRMPFFIRYPAGGLTGGKDVDQLSSAMDVLPTLLALAGIREYMKEIDGENLVPYLHGQPADVTKVYIADTQRDRYLKKYKEFSVMRSFWRLVGDELFDLRTDPGQRHDIARLFPDTAALLKAYYEQWWAKVLNANSLHPFVRIPVLSEGTTSLNCMDLFPDKDDEYTAWNQEMIKKEQNVPSGAWKLRVVSDGIYSITIRQFPEEADSSSMPAFTRPGTAFLQITDQKPVTRRNILRKKTTFVVHLPAGDIDLRTGFTGADGRRIAAQYAYIKKIR